VLFINKLLVEPCERKQILLTGNWELHTSWQLVALWRQLWVWTASSRSAIDEWSS